MRGLSSRLLFVVLFALGAVGAKPAGAGYLFEYSGPVRSVGGTVTDGSLLDVSPGEIINGSFVFVQTVPKPPPGTTMIFDPNSITSFVFGQYSAEGPEGGYSYFSLDAITGRVNSYKQVGSGSVFDTFQFNLEAGAGNSPFADVHVDLTTLDFNDFPADARFTLTRVDIDTENPLRFTEAMALLESLTVTKLPEPLTIAILGVGLVGLGVATRRCRPRTLKGA